MSEQPMPAWQAYCEARFATKDSLRKACTSTANGTARGMADGMANILAPYNERIAALEATVSKLEAKLAGIREPGKARP